MRRLAGGLLALVSASALGGGYAREIESAAARHNVPADLLRAVCVVESNLRAAAIGDDGKSIGLCQVQIDTGLLLYGRQWRAAEAPEARRAAMRKILLNPESNARLAARLLRQHLDRFEGDETLALAAYNGGPNHALIRYVLRVRAARDAARPADGGANNVGSIGGERLSRYSSSMTMPSPGHETAH